MRLASVSRSALTAVRWCVLALLVAPALQGCSPAQPSIGYDPAADPFAQLEAAKAEASEHDKRILVVAGGEWCIWCHYLDRFLHDNADVAAKLKDTFVIVKAYYGDETDNGEFFATLPEAVGYPHFWILAPDGTVLESQNTLPLEDGGQSYDRDRFLAFVDSWRS
jgi:thiol:disulfide interchange protein